MSQEGLPGRAAADGVVDLLKAGISERSLRAIERKNHPFPRHRLVDLATVLGVAAEQIIKTEMCVPAEPQVEAREGQADLAVLFPLKAVPPVAPTPPENLLQLHAVDNALRYWETARGCGAYEWTLAITPKMAVAPMIDEVLALTKRTVEGLVMMDLHNNADEFDREHEHPDIYRVARLSELIEALKEAGVMVLSNTYFHNTRSAGPNEPLRVRRLSVMFAPTGVEKRFVEIDRGTPGIVFGAPKAKQEDDWDVPF